MMPGVVAAILFGAMLFAVGMMPGLVIALREGLQNFRDHFVPIRRPFRNIPTDSQLSGDVWLVAGGGVIMILGLLALLLR
jgi:hypothetical protein